MGASIPSGIERIDVWDLSQPAIDAAVRASIEAGGVLRALCGLWWGWDYGQHLQAYVDFQAYEGWPVGVVTQRRP